MKAIKILAIDVVTFVWAVMICGAEVPRPQPAEFNRLPTWAESLEQIQSI
jgi:hypothetical protein